MFFNAFFARGIKAGPSTAEGAFPLEKYKLNHETGELVYKGGSKSGMFGVRADATGSYVGEYTTQINDVFLSYIVNDPQKYTEALLQFEKILQLELAAGGWEKYVAKLLGPNRTIVTVLCDGAERYKSKIFNEKFLQEKNFNFKELNS